MQKYYCDDDDDGDDDDDDDSNNKSRTYLISITFRIIIFWWKALVCGLWHAIYQRPYISLAAKQHQVEKGHNRIIIINCEMQLYRGT